MMEEYALADQLRRDGAAPLRGLLDRDQLADVAEAFSWSRDNPGPGFTTFPGDPNAWQDLSNPGAYEAYRGMLMRSPLPALLQGFWGGGPVWFMYEQIFSKQSGGMRTPWHQDTSYQPVSGEHVAVVWISLDPVSRDEALEFCSGSHLGPLYNASSFKPGDPTDPLYKTGNLPRLPDIEAERDEWPIVGWETEPGDAVVFHPSTLHGGGAPGPDRRRRTLTLRFFGEDATFASRPGPTSAPRIDGLQTMLRDGDPFRHPVFPQLA